MRTNFKLFRVKKGLTMREFAEKIGYTRASVSAIEQGKRDGRDTFWRAVQEAFDVPDAKMWGLKQLDE